jgi:hypothetical protein
MIPDARDIESSLRQALRGQSSQFTPRINATTRKSLVLAQPLGCLIVIILEKSAKIFQTWVFIFISLYLFED